MVIRAEEWKTIEEAPDYSVSNYGRVMRATDKEGVGSHRTFAGKILRVGLDNNGYPLIQLTSPDGKKLGRRVHRLVATAFHGPAPYEGAQVRHLNDVSTDNVAWNLKWTSSPEGASKEQLLDAIANGISTAVLSPGTACEIAMSDESSKVLSARYGVSRSAIVAVRSGRSWSDFTGLQKRVPRTLEEIRMKDEDILHIVSSPLSGLEIAARIGLSPQHVSRIRTGKVYSELTGIQYKRRNSYAHITPEIRKEAYRSAGRHKDIAARIGISKSMVSRIKNGTEPS